jgi:hypothetical protein
MADNSINPLSHCVGEIPVDGSMDQVAWDSTIRKFGGSLLQSWHWGEYRRGQGWQVERVRSIRPCGTGLAQVMFKRFRPVSLAHVPRGPVLGGDAGEAFDGIVDALDAVCRCHHAVSLMSSPIGRPPHPARAWASSTDHGTSIRPAP